MKARIAIVTTKQPGTNPRMRKNADALSAAGYDVHVLYAFNSPWADTADRAVFLQSKWNYQRLGGHPQEEPIAYTRQRIRRKWATWTGNLYASFNPCLQQYLSQLRVLQPDLVIGHNPGALPVLSKWSRQGPVLFDAEDDHPGEFFPNTRESQRVSQLELDTLNSLTHITAASPLIGKEYGRRFPHLGITPIDNAFDRHLQPQLKSLEGAALRFVWFSQVVGLDRGLQEFLQALGTVPSIPVHLTLIGLCDGDVRQALEASLLSQHHTLSFEPPLPEKDLMEKLSHHHIGLAIETGTTRNRQLCRTNKLFCYPLAGCLTLASNTRSQRQFMEEHPDAGAVYESEQQLTALVREWHTGGRNLDSQRKAAWQLGCDSLNWDTESKKLIALVEDLIRGEQ